MRVQSKTTKSRTTKASELLKSEQHNAAWLVSVFILAMVSGYVTYFIPGASNWEQWTYLLHTLSALYLTLIFCRYLILHFKRTLGTRRPIMSILGWITSLILLAMIGTGLYITFYGQTEPTRWIYQIHIWTAHAAVIGILLHLLIHQQWLRQQAPGGETRRFKTLERSLIRINIIFLAGFSGLVILATVIYNISVKSDSVVNIPNYSYAYGENPFSPAETETANNGFIDLTQIADSESCRSCHQDITKQWIRSMHGQAASDQTYVSNIKLLAEKKGIEATRYCEGCHAPVALLTGELTPGGKHGGISGSVANLEGVSCLACHNVDRIVHLKGVGSYRIAERKKYLFEDTRNPLLKKVSNFILKLNPELHRTEMGRPLLSDPKSCASCHVQFIDKNVNDWGWIKMQDEYSAWLNSHYSGQSNQSFAKDESVRCQDCHMPLVESDDPSVDKHGKIRSHKWIAANTAMPWLAGDEETYKETVKFLKSDKVRIKIEKPNISEAVRGSRYSSTTLTQDIETPFYLYLGESTELRVVVTNHGVGHDFPGGTIDINEAWVNFKVTDAENRTVFESGAMKSDGQVDENAYFYRSVPIDREGKVIWKHDLFNMTGESYRRVINAGDSDVITYKFKVPFWAKSPLSVSSTVKYRKFNIKYARWALENDQIDLPVVDMARNSMIIPLRERAEVE
ncbi:MAG: multiheme c-type cytochrome [Arenicellales bacterium]